MEHSFDIDVAEKYGIEEAIIIKNVQFWIIKNKANDRHCYEGRTWTYSSVKAFSELFPYMNESKIRRVFQSLISQGILITGNFNKSGYDRTIWYAFQNEQMHLSKMKNGFDESDEPIPDSKQDINTDYNSFLNTLNQTLGKRYRGDSKSKSYFKSRLKEGFTLKDFESAIKNISNDPHHIKHFYNFATPEFVLRSDKLDRFLNMNKEPQPPITPQTNAAYF